MHYQAIIDWLLRGDVAIRYQVYRDLLAEERPDLRDRTATEGWGAAFLARRHPEGYWGKGFYQPKWTSSHYTLLDLRHLCLPRFHPAILESIHLIAKERKSADGGINPAKTVPGSDVCVNGMFMNYACWFGLAASQLESVVDFLLGQHMADGGFNCYSNHGGARHSSMHSTLSVLEGITEYSLQGYTYRLAELEKAAGEAREFLLQHQLFLSDRTGEIIRRDFLQLSFPGRWKYNILRALDHFRRARIPWDTRMTAALAVLQQKREADGRWKLPAHHPGQQHFVMEKAGQVSRWNTLRALRVLARYPGG